MKPATRRRAEKAARILKALGRAEEFIHPRWGFVYRLPGGYIFNGRRYDDCFEMGDGDDVVRHLLALIDADADLARAVTRDPASRYVCLDQWRAKYSRTCDTPTVEGCQPLFSGWV